MKRTRGEREGVGPWRKRRKERREKELMEEERVNGAHRADIAGLELIHQLNARLTSRQACGATLPRYTATTNREGATHRQKRESRSTMASGSLGRKERRYAPRDVRA